MNEQSASQRPLPSVVYNPTTLLGATLAGLALALILFLVLLEAFTPGEHPYMGVVAFVVLPVFLLAGLALVALGMLREYRRRRRGAAAGVLPRVDLNDPRQRLAFLIFAVGTVVLAALSAFGSFQAYEYTDSNQFCGTTCHSVMHPEFTTYHASPHARVDCVDCHIGPGTAWFVRSKLSGAYQVYSVLFERHPRPLATPIASLRPSRDTCEQCHWPAYFSDDKLVVRDYYLADEANTHMRLHLLLKIGGGGGQAQAAAGIHWHVRPENQVTYVATDARRLEIPWVRVRTPDGSEKLYVAAGASAQAPPDGELRRMDCLDCHNRPSHNYEPPDVLLNRLLRDGQVDAGLPSVKSVAVEALEQAWPSSEEALAGIAAKLGGYYREEHPELAARRAEAVAGAIEAVQGAYQANYFPGMRADWKAFPDHRGHLHSPGCFRCHDGNHVARDGSTISRDCGLCHVLLGQHLDERQASFSLDGVEYQHPAEIGDAWQDTACTDCHGPE